MRWSSSNKVAFKAMLDFDEVSRGGSLVLEAISNCVIAMLSCVEILLLAGLTSLFPILYKVLDLRNM